MRKKLVHLGDILFQSKIVGVPSASVFLLSLVMAIPVYYGVAVAFMRWTAERADPALPGAFAFTQFVFRPNPFAMPGYFLGYLMIPFIAAAIFFILAWLVRKTYLTTPFLKRWPFFLGCIIGGIVLFKVILHIFWLPIWQYFPQKGDLKIQLLVLVSAAVSSIAYWKRWDILSLFRKFEGLPWKRYQLIFFLIITIFVFSPNFIYSHSHYDYFVSAVNDLRHGKIMLLDTMNQYGLLNTLFLYLFFRIFPVFSYTAFSLLFSILFIGWYAGWFFFIRKWLQSNVIAVLSVMAMIIFTQLPQANIDFMYAAPQVGPFRQLFFLPLCFLWLGISRRPSVSLLRKIAFFLTTAFSFFWFADTGISLVAATFVVLIFFIVFDRDPLPDKIRKISFSIGALISAILFLGALYSGVVWAVRGVLPNWSLLYRMTDLFSRGLFSIALPFYGFYYAYVLLFLVTGIFLAWRSLTISPRKFLVPLFIAAYGVFQFSYYISRADPLNLAPRFAFIFILLSAWWVWVIVYKKRPRREFGLDMIYSSGYRWVASFLVGATIFAFVFGGYAITRTFSRRRYRDAWNNFFAETIGTPEVDGGNSDILFDIEILRKDYADIERPPILHWYDTKILMDIDRTNLFGPFYYHLIMRTSDMDRYIEKAIQEKPEYLFVGRTDSPAFQYYKISEDKIKYFRKAIEGRYVRIRRLKTIDVYRLDVS